MNDILKQMQREQIELLQQRVEELERERDEARADKNEWSRYHQQALFKEAQAVEALAAAEARERGLREALIDLVAECEDYARINHLHNADGSPATTGAMKHARAALAVRIP